MKQTLPSRIFNIFKPAQLSSYDIIRYYKKNLPNGFGKIGHFGTLDPFACGVLLLGTGRGPRLNEYIHEYPKTYLGIGILGSETETGDNTVSPFQVDDSKYLSEVISKFDCSFIEQRLQEKFLGDYHQAPHKYSAAKFEGKPLYEWAREGVDIKKEKKKRFIHSIKVVKYKFPYLSIRVEVSSGTYIRTLFSDFSNYLGTIGHLKGLVREAVGPHILQKSLKRSLWAKDKSINFFNDYGMSLDKAYPLENIILNNQSSIQFVNGNFPDFDFVNNMGQQFWVFNQDNKLLGMGRRDQDKVRPVINLN